MTIDDEVRACAEDIKALSLPDRLRLAADLMDRRRGDLAHMIAAPIIEELGAALALRSLERRSASHRISVADAEGETKR